MRTTALAIALAAATVQPVLAESYYFRVKSVVPAPHPIVPERDSDPDPVDFADASDVTAGSVQISPILRLTDHDGIALSVSGFDAELRTCPTSDCTGQVGEWSRSVAEAGRDSYVQLRMTAGARGEERRATLSYGSRTATWTVASKGTGAYSVADMEIADGNLRGLLQAALGTSSDWTKCGYGTMVFGDEPCEGAGETLVLFQAKATGHQFGMFIKEDLTGMGSCFEDRPGFYFSTVAPAKGYAYDKVGKASISGTVEACRAFTSPIYFLFDNNPVGYDNNGTWPAGAPILTGGARAQKVPSTVQWFKRAKR